MANDYITAQPTLAEGRGWGGLEPAVLRPEGRGCAGEATQRPCTPARRPPACRLPPGLGQAPAAEQTLL